MNNTSLISIPLHVVEFCAAECARQHSGEQSVARMCEAWYDVYATSQYQVVCISLDDVEEWAKMLEPEKNANGLRTTPVSFEDLSIALDPDVVPQALESLLWAIQKDSLTASEVYQEFEDIHPLNDGNGRLGSLLYNLKRGTLMTPITPPEFKKKGYNHGYQI